MGAAGAVGAVDLIGPKVLHELHALARANVPPAGAAAPAKPFRVTLPPDRDDLDFAAAPSRESLEQQGARFVKLPRDLYDEMSALCDAQRRGELSAADQLLLTQLIRSISLQVAAGLG